MEINLPAFNRYVEKLGFQINDFAPTEQHLTFAEQLKDMGFTRDQSLEIMKPLEQSKINEILEQTPSQEETQNRQRIQMDVYKPEPGAQFKYEKAADFVSVSKCQFTPEFRQNIVNKLLSNQLAYSSIECNEVQSRPDEKGYYSKYLDIKIDGKLALESESRFGKGTLQYNPSLLNQVIETVNEKELDTPSSNYTKVNMKFYEAGDGSKIKYDKETNNVTVDKCILTKDFRNEILNQVLSNPESFPNIKYTENQSARDADGYYSTYMDIQVDNKSALEAETRFGKSNVVYNPGLLNEVINQVNEVSKSTISIENNQDVANLSTQANGNRHSLTLKDLMNNTEVQVSTNNDVLSYFEQNYDHDNKISTWREDGKVKTETDFHFLDNENPERLVSVLNKEFSSDVKIEDENIQASYESEMYEEHEYDQNVDDVIDRMREARQYSSSTLEM